MKITAVRTYILKHKLKHASGPGNHYYRERHALVVKLETDTGANGWGETAAFGGVQNLIEQQYAPILIGRNPVSFRPLWNELMGRNFGNGMAVGETTP